MDIQTLYGLGTILTFAGILIIVVATAVVLLSKKGNTGKVKGGGAIIIGPIPIVFGAGPGAQWLILLAIILSVLSVIMSLKLSRKPKNPKKA